MSLTPIQRLLLVEDNPHDAFFLRRIFNAPDAPSTEVTHVTRMSEAEHHLAARPVDIILLDLGLPDSQGAEAVRRAHAAAPHVPLVVLTGLADEAVAAQALREGAQDHVIKGQVDARGLLRVIRYARERKVMQEALLVEKERAQLTAIKMTHSAQHDSLTGLPNRTLFNDRLTQAIAMARRNRKNIAVLFLDLDGFKHINDSLGHSVGDKLLQSIARRLVDCVRRSDTVSRQGGDEFVVLLAEVEHSEDAAVTARRMLESVAAAHSIDLHDLHITTSIGVSVFPDDGLEAELLIRNADTAMYQAKENGRQNYQFFKPEMNARAVERHFIEEGLRRALERREFALHYQPKIDLKSGRITGAEALIRWTHPTRGAVSPADFIPAAEACGLIRPIGNWVLREACKQARAWVDAGLPLGTMAVNVSAMEFRDRNFPDGVFSILDETGLDPRTLELELTESVLMTRADASEATLKTLRAGGVRLAIDDFGTGYSSLSYLIKFPVDVLKIDQSFIHHMAANPGDTSIVTAVIGMGRSLRLVVVAEGVETKDELAFLRDHDCDEAQGYYFSRPVVPQQFRELLRTGISPPHLLDGSNGEPSRTPVILS